MNVFGQHPLRIHSTLRGAGRWLYWFVESTSNRPAMATIQPKHSARLMRCQSPWNSPDWVSILNCDTNDVLLSHRDGARLVASSRPSPQLVEAFETELTALTTFGFTPKLAMRTIISLGHFVSGFALEEQDEQRRYTESGDTPAQMFTVEQRAAFLQSTPTLTAALRDSNAMSGDEGFEDGMAFIIDGVAAALDRQP